MRVGALAFGLGSLQERKTQDLRPKTKGLRPKTKDGGYSCQLH